MQSSCTGEMHQLHYIKNVLILFLEMRKANGKLNALDLWGVEDCNQ